MSEPSLRTKLRILVLGLLAPFFFIFITYQVVLDRFGYAMFGAMKLRSSYARGLIAGDLGRDYPAVDVVVLGDSTAKLAFNPLFMKSVFAVNLAIHSGSNLISYHTLTSYLDHHPAPRCVLLLSQENWARNYEHFFSKVLFQNSLGLHQLGEIWRLGREHRLYPATEYTALQFFGKSFLSLLHLEPLPLAQLQAAIQHPVSRSEQGDKLTYMYSLRGWQSRNGEGNPASERHFFDPWMHQVYLNSFKPSPTEDFYLRQIARLGHERGFRVLYGTTSLADSIYVQSSEHFRSVRDAHRKELLASEPEVVDLPLKTVYPRELHSDLNHLNSDGAIAFAQEIDPMLSHYCASRDAPPRALSSQTN